MPSNKNAIVRYQILDELLSDKHHYYTRKDLFDKCNEKLAERGYDTVTKRTIELDLHDMETEFGLEINSDLIIDGRHVVRYDDPSTAMFTRQLSAEESLFLSEVLNTLGQFSGLDSFEWLDSLRNRLRQYTTGNGSHNNEGRTIIQFSRNPYLANSGGTATDNTLAGLFVAISNRVAVRVEYRKFGQTESSSYDVFPYLLKQYNDRWYLICQLVNAERDFLMTLALDRIFSFREVPEIPYKECYCDIEERYEDIVGITYLEDNHLEPILFAVSKAKVPYVITKPIHGSQVCLPEQEQNKCRKQYPILEDYVFFRVECIPNNELKELFYSFDKDIIVLHEGIREEIRNELRRQKEIYDSLNSND